MVYKKGPPFKVRPVPDICEDLDIARRRYGPAITTLFLPAGNTIAMPTPELAKVCRHSLKCFPELERITVYGSSQYIARKGQGDLIRLRRSGLTRIHVGLESGDDEILRRVRKGTSAAEQILAGQMVKAAGMQLSEYVILGLGGLQRSHAHARRTAQAINVIEPDFVRLRTLVPKIHTLLLHQVETGRFQLLSPHQVLEETRQLIEQIQCRTRIVSDHYSNYVNLSGQMPDDKDRILNEIERTLEWEPERFRPFFVGTR
jgi:radical SAM superfamily enzyme YgiQ (UPF0313 family)